MSLANVSLLHISNNREVVRYCAEIPEMFKGSVIFFFKITIKRYIFI